jgi:hypothetical protein
MQDDDDPQWATQPIHPGVAAPTLRTSQTIVLALAGGVLLFMALVYFVFRQPPRPGNSLFLTSYVAVPFSIAALVLSIVVPRLVARSALQQIARGSANVRNADESSEEAQLAQLHFTTILLGAALAEGAGFFDTVCYMVEGMPLAAFMALVMLITVLWNFPTQASAEAWCEQKRQQLEELRREASY